MATKPPFLDDDTTTRLAERTAPKDAERDDAPAGQDDATDDGRVDDDQLVNVPDDHTKGSEGGISTGVRVEDPPPLMGHPISKPPGQDPPDSLFTPDGPPPVDPDAGTARIASASGAGTEGAVFADATAQPLIGNLAGPGTREAPVEIVDDGDKPPEEGYVVEQTRAGLADLKPGEFESLDGFGDLASTEDGTDDARESLFGPEPASEDELPPRPTDGGESARSLTGDGPNSDSGDDSVPQGSSYDPGPGQRYGTDMISEVRQVGATPGSPLAYTDSQGEVKGIGTPLGSGDGMFLGFDVGAMQMEKQENQRAAEHDADKDGKGGDSGGGDSGGGDSGGGDSGGGDSGGLITHEYDNADGSHTSVYNDGTIITAYPDGTLETNYADGTVETDYPDGTLKTENPDGTTEVINPDGTKTTTGPGEEASTSTPKDDNVLTPEELAALRQQLAPLEQHRGSQNDPGTETQPAEGDAAFGAGTGGGLSAEAHHELAVSMFGQPGPGDTDFGSGGGGGGNPSAAPNFGTIDPTDDADQPPQADGPEQDPFDRQQDTLEPTGADSDESDSDSDGDPGLLVRTDLRENDPTDDLRATTLDAA